MCFYGFTASSDGVLQNPVDFCANAAGQRRYFFLQARPFHPPPSPMHPHGATIYACWFISFCAAQEVAISVLARLVVRLAPRPTQDRPQPG
jgi:hypothetical protein